MRITSFAPPASNGDFGNNATLKSAWSARMSSNFDSGVASVTAFLAARGGGTCQFYNPVTQGRTSPDLAPTAGDITWNGFPKRFLASGPGATTRFAAAEPTLASGQNRPQDEYLEWHTIRRQGKIASVQFTCEGYDYYEFLAKNAPDTLLALYRQFINPAVARADLFVGNRYNRLNRWNTVEGAMHLTHPANSLFAEVFLAASATVRRRRDSGTEITASSQLINCAQFGDAARNSDPNIGAAVNTLARQRRMITLADPVGLYIDRIDMSGFRLPDGSPATGFFRILRGSPGQTLRAVFEPIAAAAAAGITVSDVTIDGRPIAFGGQIAQKITMRLRGVASVARDIANTPVGCGPVPQVSTGGGFGLVAAEAEAEELPLRTAQ